MESLNSFKGGMNSDLARTLPQKDTYIEAYNFRITGEDSQATGALSNIRGNEFIMSFPDTGNILRITNSPRIFPVAIGSFDITITAPGLGAQTFTISYNLTFTSVNDFFKLLADQINADIRFTIYGLVAYNDGEGMSLTCLKQLQSNNILPYLPTISLSNYGADLVVTTTAIPQTGLVPIGSVNIRDEIFIITTSKTNVTVGGYGQIWRLTYDASYIDQYPLPSSSTLFQLDLLYNNNLDLDLSHPIAPTAIVGNYENTANRTIYWCDFKNKIRKFNTANPDGFWLDPTILLNVPNVDFTIPVLHSVVTGGTLKGGMYQYVYRLTNSQGAGTKWSVPSAASHIVISPETDSILNYVGTNNITSSSGKANRIKISGLDTDFDRVQVAYIWRTVVSGLPTLIEIFADEPVNKATAELDIIHTGNEATIPLTFAELEAFNYAPDICKTMAVKDNVLLVGNVITDKLDLAWDARAFRYSRSSSTTYPTGANPDDLDDVNPNQEPTSYNNFLYQENTTVLGGSGPNISYRFSIQQTVADTQPYFAGVPYKDIASTANNNLDYGTGLTYPSSNMRFDTRTPMVSQLVRGLQRDETYRFGIVFYDKKGNPGWVKWIADIKVPHIYMPNTASGDPLDRNLQYPLMSLATDGSGNYLYNNIGIEFTVDTTTINSQISGYSIVRVKREQQDKTILAQGFLHPALYESGAVFLTNYTYVWPTPGYTTAASYPNVAYSADFAHLLSPELLFVDGVYSPALAADATTHIEIVEVLGDFIGGGSGIDKNGGGKVSRSEHHKNYDSASVTINSTYRQTSGVGLGGVGKKIALYDINYVDNYNNVPNAYQLNTSFGTPLNVLNRTITSKYETHGNSGDGGSDPTCSDGVYSSGGVCSGDKTVVLTFDRVSPTAPNTIDPNLLFDNVSAGYLTAAWTDGLLDASNTTQDCGAGPVVYGTRRKYVANLKRVLTNQYGGSTVSQRSNNDYIFCNHFHPTNSTTTTYTSEVFGGDVWVKILDYAYQKKGYLPTAAIGSKKRLVGFFFPCETTLNIELREANHLNISYFPDNGSGIDTGETFGLNPVYSVETDYITFLPKPIPFNEVAQFDNRIYASGTKINGETFDSWSIFNATDYKDVDAVHGPINSLLTFNNQVYFFQDRAFGLIPVYPRAILNNGGTPDTQLQLGVGQKIDKQQYVSITTGTKHQWSTIATGQAMYWYDVLAKKLFKYSGGTEKLSDIKGLHAYFDRSLQGEFLKYDNPILQKGMCTVHDFKNNEVLFTFHDQDIPTDTEQEAAGDEAPITYNKFTVSFNEITDTFVSFYNFYPFLYITNRQIFLSPDHAGLDYAYKLYVHNKGDYCKFYNFLYPSMVKLLVNDNPTYTKVFNNLVLDTESVDRTNNQFVNKNDDTFNWIRVYNDNQNTDTQPLVLNTNIKRKERHWNIQVPRNRVNYTNSNSPNIFADLNIGEKAYGERIRSGNMTVDLRYDNTNNYSFTFHYLKSLYLISDR